MRTAIFTLLAKMYTSPFQFTRFLIDACEVIAAQREAQQVTWEERTVKSPHPREYQQS